MATTGKNFAALSASALVGTANASIGFLTAVESATASSYLNSALAVIVDRFNVDLSKANYAKNGGVIVNLSPSTPVTIDLTDLTTEAVRAGDTAFATWKEIILVNLGANAVAVGPGASNPLTTPLAGTAPTQAIAVGESTRWLRPLGVAIDGPHKTLKLDPGGSTCKIAVLIGGA